MGLQIFKPCRSGINTLLVLLLPPALVYAVLQNSSVKGSPVADVEYARLMKDFYRRSKRGKPRGRPNNGKNAQVEDTTTSA